MEELKKIAVVGSRTFNNYEQLKSVLDEHKPFILISGGAQGADTLAERYAKSNNLASIIYLADWEKHGKSAGFIRNKKMAVVADEVIAFWDGNSKGTANMIQQSKLLGKKVKIVRPIE